MQEIFAVQVLPNPRFLEMLERDDPHLASSYVLSDEAIAEVALPREALIYAMLTKGQAYVEQGIEAFEARRQDRQLRALQHKARKFSLTLVEAA